MEIDAVWIRASSTRKYSEDNFLKEENGMDRQDYCFGGGSVGIRGSAEIVLLRCGGGVCLQGVCFVGGCSIETRMANFPLSTTFFIFGFLHKTGY
jgi:hypothetical protein